VLSGFYTCINLTSPYPPKRGENERVKKKVMERQHRPITSYIFIISRRDRNGEASEVWVWESLNARKIKFMCFQLAYMAEASIVLDITNSNGV
jgi:hypothetical protein